MLHNISGQHETAFFEIKTREQTAECQHIWDTEQYLSTKRQKSATLNCTILCLQWKLYITHLKQTQTLFRWNVFKNYHIAVFCFSQRSTTRSTWNVIKHIEIIENSNWVSTTYRHCRKIRTFILITVFFCKVKFGLYRIKAFQIKSVISNNDKGYNPLPQSCFDITSKCTSLY